MRVNELKPLKYTKQNGKTALIMFQLMWFCFIFFQHHKPRRILSAAQCIYTGVSWSTLPRLVCSRVMPDVRDRQTSDNASPLTRQTLGIPSLPYGDYRPGVEQAVEQGGRMPPPPNFEARGREHVFAVPLFNGFTPWGMTEIQWKLLNLSAGQHTVPTGL